jgi:hypothetical protein
MDFWYGWDRGLHVVTLLGLPPRCRESGFRPRKSGSFQRRSARPMLPPLVCPDTFLDLEVERRGTFLRGEYVFKGLWVNICTPWEKKSMMWCHVSKNYLKNLSSQQKTPQKPPSGVNRTVSVVRMCPIPDFTVGGWNSDNIYKWGLWNGLSWINDPSFYFRDGPNPSHPHARKTLLLYWTGRVHPFLVLFCDDAWVNFPPTHARTCLTGTNWYACISSTRSWRANAHYFFNYSTMSQWGHPQCTHSHL